MTSPAPDADLVILMPVYNDWECLPPLLDDLQADLRPVRQDHVGLRPGGHCGAAEVVSRVATAVGELFQLKANR